MSKLSENRLSNSLSNKDFIRYSRQILLPEVGEEGQEIWLNTKVLVIGMGGLGHQVVQLLAAAGVGHISFVDHDKVELSNLPRQLLYDANDLGQLKAQVAHKKLQRAYPDVCFSSHTVYFDASSQKLLLASTPELIFDCTDNLASRHQINALCVKQGLPLVSAAIAHFNGQLFAYDPHDINAGCYQCLYPIGTDISQSCSQSGVLGAAVSTMASMQALMGLNLLLCRAKKPAETSLSGRLHRFDGRSLSWSEYRLIKDPLCPLCSSEQAGYLSTDPLEQGSNSLGKRKYYDFN